MSCIFCRIAAGEIPATVVASTDEAIAFRDLAPQAPEHVLVVPRAHAANLGDYLAETDPAAVGRLFALATKVGREIGPGGYRVVTNEGIDGGQTVDHLHLHVLAGRRMTWPPG